MVEIQRTLGPLWQNSASEGGASPEVIERSEITKGAVIHCPGEPVCNVASKGGPAPLEIPPQNSDGGKVAIYRLSAQIISRSSGRSAVAAAAYRAGQDLFDERYGKMQDYARRRSPAHAEIMAPAGAPGWVFDRAKLWNQVERSEKRKDAQLARELVLALPFELTGFQRREVVRAFVRDEMVALGMVADVAWHQPTERNDERNFHAHVMLTMRRLEGETFSGKKAREWDSPELLERWREKWADYLNAALERAGHQTRVDHRSFEDQKAEAFGGISSNSKPAARRGPGLHG